MKKIVSILLVLATLIPCLVSCDIGKNNIEKQYQEALQHIEDKNYEDAYKIFLTLGDYKDTEKYLSYFHFIPTSVIRRNTDGRTEDVIVVDVDENGRPIRVTDDGDIVVEINYDSQGNVIKFDDILYNCFTEYTYDQNGNRVTEKYTNDRNIELYKYVYDDNGRVVEETIETTDLEDSNPVIKVCKYTYESSFDEAGNLVRQTYLKQVDGQMIEELISEYSYDSNGILIRVVENEKTNVLFNNIYYLRVYDMVTEYAYDANGNLLSKCWTREREGKKTDEVRIDYTYDESGKLIKENKRDESFGGNFIEFGMEVTYASWQIFEEIFFDENGKVTKRTILDNEIGKDTEQRFDGYGNIVYQKDTYDMSFMDAETEITYALCYLPNASEDDLDMFVYYPLRFIPELGETLRTR